MKIKYNFRAGENWDTGETNRLFIPQQGTYYEGVYGTYRIDRIVYSQNWDEVTIYGELEK